jgi:hypothetical protein
LIEQKHWRTSMATKIAWNANTIKRNNWRKTMSETQVVESKQQFSLAPQNIEEALKFAEMLSKSNLVPKDFQGNPGNILVSVQWGMELGLQPMQAMQNIAVINGRPSLWGDAVLALVKASPACEYVVEEVGDTQAVCRVKRRGEPEQIRTFSMDDAQKAGLKGKQGPWTNYPKRMMQMRARSWAVRDVFPDVLRGMPIAEELQDIPEKNITAAAQVLADEKPGYSDDQMAENLPKWMEYIKAGKRTPDEIITTVSASYTLTDKQKQSILSIKPDQPLDDDPFVNALNAAEGGAA